MSHDHHHEASLPSHALPDRLYRLASVGGEASGASAAMALPHVWPVGAVEEEAMTCKIIRSDDGKIIAIACGSPWGMGAYYHCHDETCFCGGESFYGFPPDEMNPEDFTPDFESCTPKELAAYEEALRVWRTVVKP